MNDDNNFHVISDEYSRIKKSEKIIKILSDKLSLQGKCILDIGTGSGYISKYISSSVGAKVFSIDVADNTKTKEGYSFKLYSGKRIPFPDFYFDVVVTNHVIEHVGDRCDQINHLNEIYRVLKPDGIVYFAVPNRWSIVEPHYKLPFLSWMKTKYATNYLRLAGRGEYYDCLLLSDKDAQLLFRETGFLCTAETLNALRLMAKIENMKLYRILSNIPDVFLNISLVIIPTLVFTLKKKND